MTLFSLQHLTCTQGAKTLFTDIELTIEEGEKIALVGINGSGKSTLLKQIVALAQNPTANAIVNPRLKLTYLAQTPTFIPEHSILDHLFSANTPTSKVIRDYHLVLETPELSNNLADIMTQMDLLNAWDYEARVTSILTELQIHNLAQPMHTLSGGMIKKITLAQAFIEDTDLLIMDEPTNHLDIDTISWLENALKRLNVTLLMVTHDRYFLDKICTKILEIDQKTLFTYQGNYQAYLEQKAERLLNQQRTEDSLQSILRVELEWLKRGPKARSTKQKARKQRIETMQNRDTIAQDSAIELGVTGRRLGKKIVEIKAISKAFDARKVIRDFSYSFKQNEKIGILGPNGSGKTTLLNILTQRLAPDQGEVDLGINTVFGYFDQHSQDLDPTLTIYEHIQQIGQFITLHDGTQLSATKLLERFLFPGQMLKTKIGDLSGGERRRLHLVCILLTNPNFLLFDEPTNDLDITTLSILEEFLLNFAGCVIVISHDRYFMDRVIDQLLIFEPGGTIAHFTGNYSDYAEKSKLDAKSEAKSPASPASATKTDPSPPLAKLNHTEQRELKQLENDIEALETEIKDLNQFFTDAVGSLEAFQSAGQRLKDATQTLDTKVSRWEALASRT